ncbi:MAG: acetate--CoA ligase family protein [Desulfatibacillaceae bacterium]
MSAKQIVTDALERGAKALDEAESKKILDQYGIPVVPEILARDPDAAAAAAVETGFPVVLKGLSAAITHKSDAGLVKLGLSTREDVAGAARSMLDAVGDRLDGFLVQPMVTGKREFLCGMRRDPQFGPVIMFGLGGVYTEALEDIALRLAPLDEADAREMIREIRASRLLDDFRGERGVDRGKLVGALMGLSRLALDLPEVAEVDINPLLATSDGDLVAVDALVVPGKPADTSDRRTPVAPEDIGALFYPRSIAFVGASARFGKWGHLLFTNVAANGYEGDMYLVNAKGGEIAGRTAYTSVSEIPGPVDLAVVTVPAAAVPDLLPEFAEKGIRNVLLITSGFGETGPDGKELERNLVQKARDLGILILGPNTMGISNPHARLFCTGSHVETKPGSIALVAQSGNMGTQILAFAQKQGIGTRAFAGTGNEAMITVEDFMEGFAVDRLTDTVLLYIESVKDGRRFFESAKRVGAQKPIVILKGGRTEAGQTAAASHTGAMATNERTFDAVCRQAGIIQVTSPMDLLDLSAAFSSMPLPRGKRVAIVTLGGGWGVVTADLCAEACLDVPELSDEVVRRFDELLPEFWSRGNPVDLVGINRMETFMDVSGTLMRWDGCDAMITLGITGRRWALRNNIRSAVAADPDMDEQFLQGITEIVDNFEEQYIAHLVKMVEECGKPVFGVGLLSEASEKTLREVEGSRYRGVFFETPERAVRALAGMVHYREFLDRLEKGRTVAC